MMKGDTLLTLNPILKFIIRTAEKIINLPSKIVNIPQIVVFVMQMEGIALCFLPTPLSSTSLLILEHIINIIIQENIVDIAQIPINNYKAFIEICKEDGKFDSSDLKVFEPLRDL